MIKITFINGNDTKKKIIPITQFEKLKIKIQFT